ncbi:ATP-binding protein [Geomonas oryzae]|uniref:ATP-binding protein n=1 Tax=Geomonas oryzae TaxID=2364273 RepID=UPI00100AB528|nr:ATP-binding protein [Geomonas oryzae]
MDHARRQAHFTTPQLLTIYNWGLAAGWTLVIATLLIFNYHHEMSQAAETARTQARSNFQRDLVYRHWNAASGAVYVPVCDRIQPNPYLSGIPERDVITTSGRHLTLVNPSYMSRLVFELASDSFGVKGHITSLTPLRPQNRPDDWERGALLAFERGSEEESTVVRMAGGSYLRLMKPLKTERACLRCHEKQGCRLGGVRGGLSVAVPMTPLWNIAKKTYQVNAASFLLLWGLGMAGIHFGAGRLRLAIAERDLAQRSLIETNRDLSFRSGELAAANRDLDAFCSTVSHDLRSPLTAVSGYCQLLKESLGEKGEEARAYTDVILASTAKMEGLITSLLRFARIARNELVPADVDLTAIAADMAAELRAREPQRQAVFVIADGLTARGDAGLLRVVLQNLMENAWKYSGLCPEARIEVGLERREDGPFFFVRDNGIGFDEAEAARVFEAFRRLENALQFEGTGIGLATVKRIIERHGGRIDCKAKPGYGATFYFSLP